MPFWFLFTSLDDEPLQKRCLVIRKKLLLSELIFPLKVGAKLQMAGLLLLGENIFQLSHETKMYKVA